MIELLTPEERAQEVKRLVSQLQAEGRKTRGPVAGRG